MKQANKHWNSQKIAGLLLATSQHALKMQPNMQIFEKKINDHVEAYTNVDVQIEKEISQYIQNTYPQYSIVGEETIAEVMTHTNIASLLDSFAIVVDPIDGTQNFINKLPNWAISIGQVIDNEFVNGAIALPILGEIWVSEQNKVYSFHAKSQLSEIQQITLTPYRYPQLASTNHLTYCTANIYLKKLQDTSYKFQIIRSCVYGIAKVLSGSYFAYIGKANIWDFAGSIGLFRALDMPVYYFDKQKNSVETLPWTISETHWDQHIKTRYPLIFASSYDNAIKVVPLR